MAAPTLQGKQCGASSAPVKAFIVEEDPFLVRPGDRNYRMKGKYSTVDARGAVSSRIRASSWTVGIPHELSFALNDALQYSQNSNSINRVIGLYTPIREQGT